MKTIVCSEKEQEFGLVPDQGGRSLSFHRRSGFPVGFSDTIWYGGDHFNYGHHIEGLPAIVHFRKSGDATCAGDIAELELRDNLPEPLTKP